MFDPRLTEEYCGLAGMPWSDQDASGELAAMAIGASLWGFCQSDRRVRLQRHQARPVGCQYGYRNLQMDARQRRVRPARAPSGLRVARLAGRIIVNMLGKRFYDETGRSSPPTTTTRSIPIRQGSYLNAKQHRLQSAQFAQRGDGRNRRRP